MKIRQIETLDRKSYTQLRSLLDAESDMWGVALNEREDLGDYGGKQFDQVLSDDRSAIFIATDDVEVAGFLSLETFPWKSLSRTSVLCIGVLESHQGTGLASMLVAAAEEWARSIGIHRIELLVYESNSNAIKLYEKLGYVHEGVRRESSYLHNEHINELYMAKILV